MSPMTPCPRLRRAPYALSPHDRVVVAFVSPAPAANGPARRVLARRHVWLAAVCCVALAMGLAWLLQQRVLTLLQDEVQRDTDYLAEQVQSISSDGRVMGGVVLLGLTDPHIKALVEGRTTAQDPGLQAMLAAVIGEYSADLALVLDRQGMTVAYRAEDGSARGLGRDLSVRPYFKRAIVGFPNLYPAIGKNTGERGIYLAAPVRARLDPQAEPVGVVVVKISAERIDAQLSRFPHTALLVSPEGVVFGGNRQQWLLQTVEPVSAAEQATLAREERYGSLFANEAPPMLPLQPTHDGALLAGARVTAAFAALDWPAARRDWRLLVLRERNPAENWGEALAGGAAMLATSLTLVFALLRRQARRARRERERSQAQAAVARELAFQQRLIDALPNPLFIKDSQGRYTTLNRAFEQAYGVRRTDFIGRTVRELTALDPSVREEVHARDMRIVQSGVRHHEASESRWADGRVRQTLFWGQGLREADGTPSGLVGVLLDVSEQAQAREALRKSERQLRDLLESAPGTVIVADDEGHVLFHNQQALEMFGVDAQTLTAQGMRVRYADVTRRDELFARLRRDGLARAADVEMVRGDGGRFWAEVSFSRGNFGAQSEAAFGWCVDVTERKQAAQAMQAAKEAAEDAVAAKSAFLANMSHEIRTPMNAIIGQAHLALQTQLTDPQRDHILKVHHAARALLRIVNDVLDFSRIEADELAVEQADFDLDALFGRLALLAGAKAGDQGLELVFDIGDEVPRQLHGDAQHLEQVLTNLLTNAVKFTTQGDIRLQCRHRRLDGAALELAIEVHDSGVGMAPAQMARLFQPFSQADESSTRRFGGTGLGLAICKRLVDAAGGRISVDSQPGAGTCFRFSWPCQAGAAQLAPSLPLGLTGVRVLVVEAHALAGPVLASALARTGLAVERVTSAQEAMDWISTAGAARTLVLAGQQLPDLDGLTLLRRLRAAAADTALVLVAPWADAALREQAAQAGAAILSKPVAHAALMDGLASLHAGAAQALERAGADPVPRQGLLVDDDPQDQQLPLVRPASHASATLTDAQARSGLSMLCEMLEAMDGDAGSQLERMRPWLQRRLAAGTMQQLLRHVQQYDLDEALALLREAPALASWRDAAGVPDAPAAPAKRAPM